MAIIAAAGALGIAVVTIVLSSPAAPSSALLGYRAGCPRAPMDQVPDAATYQVEVACARISGTVRTYRLNQAFDELELTVVPDRRYLAALAPANDGHFTVDILGPDLSAVQSPDLGGDAVFYGSWVRDRVTHALMLTPTWRITATSAGDANPDSLLFSAQADRHYGQAFKMSVAMPAVLSPGVGPDIVVTARWGVPAAGKRRGTTVPASQIRILAEVIGPSGQPLAWKAAQTGTLGIAAIRPSFIVTTGHYTYRLYAIADGQVVSISRHFRVGKT